MRICFLVKAVPTHQKGGLQDIVMMLATGLTRAGNSVTIITTRHPKNVEKEVIDGVTVYYVSGAKSSVYSRAWWKQSLDKFAELHASDPFDIVHSHSIAGFSVIKNKRKMRPEYPTVITMHGTFRDELKTKINIGLSISEWTENARLVGGLGKQLLNFCVHEYRANRMADLVVATSNEQYHLIRKLYNLPAGRVKIVYNGIDLNGFQSAKISEEAIRSRHRIPDGKKIILALARLHKEKGIQYLIEALPIILEKFPGSILLVVGDGRYKARLVHLSEKNGVRDGVIFAGKVDFDELSSYFRSSDVFVNPTIRQNGYDLTILEGMECEVPVVATNIGSVPTAIKHKVNGILVKIKDREDLANGISYVLDPGNRDSVAELVSKAKDIVSESFSMDAMIGKTLDSYQDLIRRKRHEEITISEQ